MEETESNPLNEGATYLVRLHLDNDQGLHTAVRRMVKDALPYARKEARTVWTDKSTERSRVHVEAMRASHVRAVVGDLLYEWVEDETLAVVESGTSLGDPICLLATDLVNQSLRGVEWSALAGSYIEDLEEEEKRENDGER